MQVLITFLFTPKPLQRQKRYLRWGLLNPQNSRIRDFIFCNQKYHLVPLSLPLIKNGSYTPRVNIIELVGFTPTHKCQERLLVQAFNPVSKSLNDLVELCGRLDMDEDIFQDMSDGT